MLLPMVRQLAFLAWALLRTKWAQLLALIADLAILTNTVTTLVRRRSAKDVPKDIFPMLQQLVVPLATQAHLLTLRGWTNVVSAWLVSLTLKTAVKIVTIALWGPIRTAAAPLLARFAPRERPNSEQLSRLAIAFVPRESIGIPTANVLHAQRL